MTDREEEKELQACSPIAVDPDSFNPDCDLPYGLETIHIYQAMNEFIDFIGFINEQLKTKDQTYNYLDKGETVVAVIKTKLQ